MGRIDTIKNHLSYLFLREGEIDKKKAKLHDLRHFVRDRELDKAIKEKFPLHDFGKLTDDIDIKGTKDLLDLFDEIDDKKYDILETLENIEYIGVSHDSEIIIKFSDDIKGVGVYNFTFDFFEELFDMGKYAKFCIKNGLNDLLKENLLKLLEEFKTIEKQFRLLDKNDTTYIRAITSTRYNNYDNHLAIYLILLSLHKLVSEEKISIYVKEAHISDSALRIIFEQEEPIRVEGVGQVYFGFLVSNGEIRDSKFTFEMRYRIIDGDNDKGISFAAIPNLEEAVFNIQHSTGVDNVISKLNNINNIHNIKYSMLEYIEGIKKVNKLSDNIIYLMRNKIKYSKLKDLKYETKDNFNILYEKNMINNTMTLIEGFGKINEITTDVEERIYLERIYHDIIKDLVDRQKG
ncbi:hypothetical protein [Sporosalibacterium faouarense]|uniref:hypothetical protein n=1 Tax=Sporosalibacterium faouarense TaxID=516123 RepID=UPI00192BEB6C|nr:hypothetical protein [Sporosalibacterium faouarense]